MTRLDASNEPSMEDILASIRKIIAEDPPGSRAAPTMPAAGLRGAPAAPSAATAQPARQTLAAPTSSVFNHTPQRDMAFDARLQQPEPVQPSPATEPVMAAVAPKPESKSFIPSPSTFFPKDMSPPAPRVEPSFARPSIDPAIDPASDTASGPASDEQAAPRGEPTEPGLLSVDAQLSELLGDVMHAPLPMPRAEFNEPQAEPLISVSSSTSFQSSFPASTASAARVEHRDGFTVSRVAFGEPEPSAPSAIAEPDPFDFDLGPSPFEPRIEPKPESKPSPTEAKAPPTVLPPAPVQTTDPGAVEAFDFTLPMFPKAAAPSAPVETVQNQSAPAATRSRLEELVAAAPRAMPSVSATLPPAPPATATPEAPAMQSVIPDAPAAVRAAAQTVASEAFVAPSIARASVPVEAFVPEAPFVETSSDQASVVEAPVVHASVVAPPVAASTIEAIGADASVAAAATADSASHPVAVIAEPPHIIDPSQRSMEDTVAELLRPMLRTWLAENMPRIVERALRREVAEQLQSNHKTAAE